MSYRPTAHTLIVAGLLCCAGLNPFVPRCSAQELAPPDAAWPFSSLMVRDQDPESEAMFEPAEFDDHLETDRDSFTPATTTVGTGRSILEAAYSFIDNRGAYDSHSFPESLLRYGLTERFELRLGWNYEAGGASSTVSGSSVGDVEPGVKLERASEISYGAKFGITEQNAWIPQSAFLAHAYTPTSGPATTTDFVGTYVFGWELPNMWLLDAALRYGITTEEHDHFNQWSPSVVLKVPVTEKWFAHVEYFSINTAGRERNRSVQYLTPGVHYLITPDIEVGVRMGWGLNDDSANFFNNVGIGWRF